ncbi:MAG TPA: hypothetical protein VN554_02105 [Verrucomicrobiae bacterium]|nr:hypothetical protein [Verrucomicrobiae bacterium]
MPHPFLDLREAPGVITDIYAIQWLPAPEGPSRELIAAYVACELVDSTDPEHLVEGFEDAKGTLVRAAVAWETTLDGGTPSQERVLEREMIRRRWHPFNPDARRVRQARERAGGVVDRGPRGRSERWKGRLRRSGQSLAD